MYYVIRLLFKWKAIWGLRLRLRVRGSERASFKVNALRQLKQLVLICLVRWRKIEKRSFFFKRLKELP